MIIKKHFFILIITLAVGVIILYQFRSALIRRFYSPTPSVIPEKQLNNNITKQNSKPEQAAVEVVAENLSIPWEIAFLPDGDMLVTERTGSIKRIKPDGSREALSGLPTIKKTGEGGLLGLALHPQFKDNQWLYLYFTSPEGGGTICRVERYRLDGNELTDRQLIIAGIPGAIYHDGGRMAFGSDGYLYITTGDATKSNLAQDKNSLAGKILRLKDDGSIPADNPFGTAVYSYGHRNPQGIAWDDKGRLWSNEHGRSGVLSGFDEINLIEPGANYGWPEIQGNERRDGMKTPVINSGPNETWAPAGLVYFKDRLWFTGLRGEGLYSVAVDAAGKLGPLQKYLFKQFGRLRAITVGPDGLLYISTSNKDGRGEVRPGDDKIIRLVPENLR